MFELVGPSGDFFGGAVAGLGDIDGHDDLAVGANQEGNGGAGAVGVFEVRPRRWLRPR